MTRRLPRFASGGTGRRAALAGGLGLLALGAAAPAQAQPVLCSLVATPLVFGVVDVLHGGAADSTARLDVTCTTLSPVPVPVQLRLSLRGGVTAADGRRMGHPAAPAYQIYVDAARSLPLGDGPLGTTLTASGVAARLTPFRQVFTLYGRIRPGQRRLPAGQYRDTLSVVLDY